MRNLMVISVIAIFLGLGCKTEVEPTRSYEIEGKWNLTKAYRNSKETKTLSAAFFDIDTKDSLMSSNIFQNNESQKFSLDKNLIVVKNEDLYLNIDKLEIDTMILKGKISSFEMEFHLEREKEMEVDSLKVQ